MTTKTHKTIRCDSCKKDFPLEHEYSGAKIQLNGKYYWVCESCISILKIK